MIKKFLKSLIEKASERNVSNIISMIEYEPGGVIVDLGCDEGDKTLKFAGKAETKSIIGVELIEESAEKAKQKGIETYVADLNSSIPLKSRSVDVAISNQVIEHLDNTDKFIEEIFRILKDGGYAIISTESLSSWHNIFALILGFQPFSSANYSKKGSIGNPLSLWRSESSGAEEGKKRVAWLHKRLFAYRGLLEVLKLHNFKIEKVKMAGYYPIFDISNLDKRHGHLISVKIRK